MPALEPFPIIPLTDDMILQDEPMGSKDKFWCQLPDCGSTPTGFDPFPTPRDPPLIEPRWGSMEMMCDRDTGCARGGRPCALRCDPFGVNAMRPPLGLLCNVCFTTRDESLLRLHPNGVPSHSTGSPGIGRTLCHRSPSHDERQRGSIRSQHRVIRR